VEESIKQRHRFHSACGRYIYHIGIIDYLTEWGLPKKIEAFYKVTIMSNKEELISAVNPDLYARRFIEFMKQEVILNEQELQLDESIILNLLDNCS